MDRILKLWELSDIVFFVALFHSRRAISSGDEDSGVIESDQYHNPLKAGS